MEERRDPSSDPPLQSPSSGDPFRFFDKLALLLDRLDSTTGVVRSNISGSITLPCRDRLGAIDVSIFLSISGRANSSSLVSLELSWAEDDPVVVGETSLVLQAILSASSVYDRTYVDTASIKCSLSSVGFSEKHRI